MERVAIAICSHGCGIDWRVWSKAYFLIYEGHSNSAELNRTLMVQDKRFVPWTCYYIAADLLPNTVLERELVFLHAGGKDQFDYETSCLKLLTNTNREVGPRTDVVPQAYALFISHCHAADDKLQPGSQGYVASGDDDSYPTAWCQQAVSSRNEGI